MNIYFQRNMIGLLEYWPVPESAKPRKRRSIQQLGNHGDFVRQMNQNMARRASRAEDGIPAALDYIYEASVRHTIERQFRSPENVKKIQLEMRKGPGGGVLVVIRSHVHQTFFKGPVYSNIRVHIEEWAPDPYVAYIRHRRHPPLEAAPRGNGRLSYAYLWVDSPFANIPNSEVVFSPSDLNELCTLEDPQGRYGGQNHLRAHQPR